MAGEVLRLRSGSPPLSSANRFASRAKLREPHSPTTLAPRPQAAPSTASHRPRPGPRPRPQWGPRPLPLPSDLGPENFRNPDPDRDPTDRDQDPDQRESPRNARAVHLVERRASGLDCAAPKAGQGPAIQGGNRFGFGHSHAERDGGEGERLRRLAARRDLEGHRRPAPGAWSASSSASHQGARPRLEGVPGLAKTLAIRTLAETIEAEFRRIQFTPDLLPADLIGTQIYNQSTASFSVRRGAGLRQSRPGRRDQPRAGEGAVRTPRGDAGAPGHHRRSYVPSPRSLLRPGDAEPYRAGGHLPTARGPGRPRHDAGEGGLPHPRGGAHHHRAHERAPHVAEGLARGGDGRRDPRARRRLASVRR